MTVRKYLIIIINYHIIALSEVNFNIMNNEYINPGLEPVWKGTDFWTEEIKKAGILKDLNFFNDVIVEKRPPHSDSGYGDPILTDIILDGKKTDIYHCDKNKHDTGHRVFLYIKE